MTTAVALRDSELMLGGPIGSLDHYIQAVSAVPILTREEELELAVRLREHDDLEAAQRHEIAFGGFRKATSAS